MSKIQLTTGNPLKGKIGHGQGFIRLETLIDRHKIDTFSFIPDHSSCFTITRQRQNSSHLVI